MVDGIDRDDVSVGQSTETSETTVELELLLTFDASSRGSEDLIHFEVSGNQRQHVDFGMLQPSWMSEPGFYD